MFEDQKFRSKEAERGNCALYVENSYKGFFEVGGADSEMIALVTHFLNRVSQKPGNGQMAKNNLGYEPGDELDILMAERVFGYEILRDGPVDAHYNPRGLYYRVKDAPDSLWTDLPYYSTNTTAAWLIIDHIRGRAESAPTGKLGSPEWRKFVSYTSSIHFWTMNSADAAFLICVSAAETLKQ